MTEVILIYVDKETLAGKVTPWKIYPSSVRDSVIQADVKREFGKDADFIKYFYNIEKT